MPEGAVAAAHSQDKEKGEKDEWAVSAPLQLRADA
jgi:hypothetical protein